MFYGIPKENPGDQADSGHYQATLRTILIAIESALVVMPLNICAVVLFR